MPSATQAISPNRKAALLECAEAAIALVPLDLREEFIIVGGTASILLSSDLLTEDVDFAASERAVIAFWSAIERGGTRFRIHANYAIGYDSSFGFQVPVEVLQIGGGFINKITGIEPILNGFVASVPDLIYNRAETLVSRGSSGDAADFKFLVDMAIARQEKIPKREDDDMLILEQAAETLPERKRIRFNALMISD